jgi:hypothetical protein
MGRNMDMMGKERKKEGRKEGRWVWWLIPVIPATQETEIRKIRFKASPGKKVSKIPSQSISQTCQCMPVVPATQEDHSLRPSSRENLSEK